MRREAPAETGAVGGAGFEAMDAPSLGVQTSAGRRGGPLWSRWLWCDMATEHGGGGGSGGAGGQGGVGGGEDTG